MDSRRPHSFSCFLQFIKKNYLDTLWGFDLGLSEYSYRHQSEITLFKLNDHYKFLFVLGQVCENSYLGHAWL